MTLEQHVARSGVLGEDRVAWSCDPFVEADAPGLLVLLDGEFYRERMPTFEIVEGMQRSGELPAFRTILVDQGEREARWRDTMCSTPFARFLAEELPVWCEAEFGPSAWRSIGGLSLTGLQSTFTALRCPGVYDRVFAQSPSFWWADESVWAELPERIDGTTVYASCGLDEGDVDVDHGHGLVQRVSQLDGCRSFVATLRERGASVVYEEIPGGHDFDTWTRDLPTCLGHVVPNRGR